MKRFDIKNYSKRTMEGTMVLGLAVCMTFAMAGCTKTNPETGQVTEGIRTEDGGNVGEQTNTSGAVKTAIDKEALKADADRGLLFLINKENAVDSAYKPEDLEPIKYFATDRSEAGRFMRKEAADAFHSLSEAAKSEGFEIVVTTAYRSYDFQKILYDNYVKNYGQAEADTFSAKPGTSEHQSGLAADVSSPSVNYQLTEEYIDTAEGSWLSENAYKYGFIIRFPKGKESVTGYMYEPWHIRYVGKTAAEVIFNEGMTLEEFLAEQYLEKEN